MSRPARRLGATMTAGALLAIGGCGGTGVDRVGSATPPTTASASVQSSTPFDGVYEMGTSEADAQKTDPNVPAENWGHYVFVFGRGRFAFTQDNNHQSCTWAYGTYTVTGSQVTWLFTDGGGFAPNHSANEPGEQFDFAWTRYRDTMTLSAVPGAVSPVVLYLKPWHRLSSSPSGSSLNKRCLPPAAGMTW